MLATTTPYDLVKPFADRLGLDDVVATRYGVDDDDDTYDGTLVGPVRVVDRQAGGGAGVGRGTRHRPRGELRLLRQRVRHAAAVGRRAPRRRQPRSADGVDGRRPTMADAQPRRVARGHDGAACIGMELQKLALAFSRPAMVPVRRHRDHRRRAHPGRPGPSILVANHRSYFDPMVMAMVVAKTGRTVQVPRQEGSVRRPRRRRDRHGDGRHPRRPRHGLRRAAAAGRRGARRPARWSRSCPRARSRAGRRSSTRTQGPLGGGAPRADDRRAGDPGRAVGHRSWCGPDRRGSRRCSTSPTRRPCSATVGKPVELKGKSLDADTKRIMKAITALLPAEAQVEPGPDAGRTGGDLSAGVPRRSRPRGRPPPRNRLNSGLPADSGGQSPVGSVASTQPSASW